MNIDRLGRLRSQVVREDAAGQDALLALWTLYAFEQVGS